MVHARETDPEETRFEVERGPGRLVLARVHRLADAHDVDAYAAAFAPSRLGHIPQPVLCADHRPVRIYSQPVTELLAETFRTLNRRWHRVAILVSNTNATLAMQLQRIVRESVNPSRRVFADGASALVFLGDVLTPEELTAVRAFLGAADERSHR